MVNIFRYLLGILFLLCSLGTLVIWYLGVYGEIFLLFLAFSALSYLMFHDELDYIIKSMDLIDENISRKAEFSALVLYICLLVMMVYPFKGVLFLFYLFVSFLVYKYFKMRLRDIKLIRYNPF